MALRVQRKLAARGTKYMCSEIPVTRGEGKKNLGVALLSSPLVTVTHQK